MAKKVSICPLCGASSKVILFLPSGSSACGLCFVELYEELSDSEKFLKGVVERQNKTIELVQKQFQDQTESIVNLSNENDSMKTEIKRLRSN